MAFDAQNISYPLSSMQQGMLFHTFYLPEAGIDIEQIVCDLSEVLNIPAFQQAWQRVVQRHPVFRTSFHWEGFGQPFQTVHPHIELPWYQKDYRQKSRQEQQDLLEAYLRTDRQQSFQLSQAPLMRLTLFQLAEDDYQLVWTFHHALLDGRSFPFVLEEVFAFYEAFCQGQDLERPVPRPYQDYITWLQQQDFSQAKPFWQQYLDGFYTPSLLTSHTNSGKPADDFMNYAEYHLSLTTAETERLTTLAQQTQLTLNNLVQGALALLIHHHTGLSDTVFGATRACRRSALAGAETMVGLLINTLPVRLHINPQQSVLSWLQDLREQQRAMWAYEHTPLASVQKWSLLPDDVPLFDTLLVFSYDSLHSALRARGGPWESRVFEVRRRPNTPLTLMAFARPTLSFTLIYDRQFVNDETAERLLHHLKNLLRGIAHQPERPLVTLSPLSEAEEHQILYEWNNTQADYPKDACIHHLFEAQAAQTPQAIAAQSYPDLATRLTYQDINQRANQLAHFLRKIGVGPETPVAICVERSAEMVAWLLGILKAGGTYIPLDPVYPPERLLYMLTHSQTPVLLTQQHLVANFQGINPYLKVICLDSDWSLIAQEGIENPDISIYPANLAYIIYTSGSTGRPKGVQIPHQAVVNFLYSMRQQPGITAEDILLAVTTLAFDIAGLELFLPFCVGARTVIASQEVTADGYLLAEAIEQTGATLMQATPATWRLLLENGWPGNDQLKILCGGEPLPKQLAERLLKRCRSLWNLYGPTETTIWSAVYEVTTVEEAIVPIGRPIANTQIYLLDASLRPVPVGVPGELYIGGDGLARGYLHQPELTAERFLNYELGIMNYKESSPFIIHNSSFIIYKTGDLARYLPDGRIEFLGRGDYQVKIRGFRVELGEIEAVLEKHLAVHQAVVVARDEGGRNGRHAELTHLVAYFSFHSETLPSSQELRVFAGEYLPAYMIPAVFVPLASFPLTPNGKIDRRALPETAVSRPETAPYTPPQTPVEVKLARAWQEILGVDSVGVHDNFFELGGHSLLAMRLMAWIRDTFGVVLRLQLFFSQPTLAALAGAIEQAPSAQAKTPIPALVPLPRQAHRLSA